MQECFMYFWQALTLRRRLLERCEPMTKYENIINLLTLTSFSGNTCKSSSSKTELIAQHSLFNATKSDTLNNFAANSPNEVKLSNSNNLVYS